MFSVIFDMDGTLLDTQKICVPAWEYAGNLQGISGVGQLVYSICGMNETGWTNRLMENYPTIDIPVFKATVRRYYKEKNVIKFKKGAKELLDFLKQNGIRIAVASGSSRSTVENHFGVLGALDYFDAIVGGNEVENGKPAPDIFLRAAEMIGAEPSECFVFEDSPNGVRAGYNAGMRSIGVPDMVTFSDDVKKLMFTELEDLSQAIDIFKKEIDNA